MKKTLIALCVAMASGSAMAWTTGDFNGSVDIGGTIEKTDYKAKWQWKTGDGFNTFENTTNELRSNGTKLVIAITEDKPILLGKTSEAFSSSVGGAAAVPNIVFKGYDGNEVSLLASGSGGDGTHYLELPIHNGDAQDKIGTLRVNVTAAGVVAKEADSDIQLNSLHSTQSSEVFFGGLVSNAVVDSATVAAATTAKFGSLSASELQKQVQDVSGTTLPLTEGTSKATETLVDQDGKVAAAAYAMGMVQGQTLEATFDNAITTETAWKAPMNIEVSYY
ncbi:hypothetical protein OGY83_18050 [Citrobacter sp. Cpo090]|uniref:F4 family fimbrial subunit n=1 Tax=Citrobacter sp. Cpo090 TaxID=2985139 RepID=UPI002577C364|nr:hypothetical protein [Citrobacter sp. Cpo090]MDM2845523.1 hypothetical protein [Citrobacter sp. Cpo090]